MRAGGIEVWFDQSELRDGDAWDAAIRKQIKTCALFVPIISNNTHAREEGYFRFEWKLAVDRSHLMATSKTFLLPVSIDDTRDDDQVPDKFREVQWTQLPWGAIPPEFVERVLRLLYPERQVTAALAQGLGSARAVAGPARNPASFWRSTSALLLMAAALAVPVGYFVKFTLPQRVAQPRRTLAPAVESSAPAQPSIGQKSIAVLPFVDMSEKKDQEYFGDGLSEELINLLAKTQELQVIARTSSFYFKGKPEKITTIARELGVTYVLEGSVRKAGNTFRVTAQLIRADNGVHQWSDSYDRNLKDIFKVQDEIAASVVHALQATLLAHVPRAERDAANIDSYTRMWQARFLIGRGSEADTRQSIVILERALALDPSYAPAWTELSRAHAFLDAQVDSAPGANIVQARAAAEKALALDPASADAHAALADIKLNYDLDAQGAAAETDAARRADPGTPRPDLLSLYSGCIAGPCYEELIGDLSRIVNRDPLNADAYAKRAMARRLGGQLADAEHDARRALQLSPQRSSGYSALTEILIVRHDLGNLLATAQREPSGPHHRWAVALAYQALGRRADAQRALENLVTLDAANWAFQIGQVYAMRGEVAESLDWLERAYRQHDQGLWVLKVDQTLASIHGDPRYQVLLRKMGLSH